jgi:Tol biopolymer transport system component
VIRSISAAALVFAVVVSGLAGASKASSFGVAAHARFEAELLFVRVRGSGVRDIYSTNLDGSRQRRLTWDHADETSPQWLSNGLRIGYARYDGNNNIVVMNSDGSGKRNLVRRGATSPTWSPDGRKVAYTEAPVLKGSSASTSQTRTAATSTI